MSDLNHDLLEHIDRCERKIDDVAREVVSLRIGLEVHKAKTGKFSLILGGLASLLVAVAAMLIKGCA